MSLPIRKLIGPAIGYLRERITIANNLLSTQLKDAEQIINLRKELVRLTKTFTRLEGAQNEWLILLRRLEGDELDAESTVYDEFKLDGKHFMEYVEQARQLIDDIEIELADYSSAENSINESIMTAQNQQKDPPQVEETITAIPPSIRPKSNPRRNLMENREDFGDKTPHRKDYGFGDNFGDKTPHRKDYGFGDNFGNETPHRKDMD